MRLFVIMNSALARAQLSLDGLSVGDAFGERFFVTPAVVEQLIADRAVPKAPWRWTDDTAMAATVVEALRAGGSIDPDELAPAFAGNFVRDPERGYGRGAREILTSIHRGLPWREAAGDAFEGRGSLGNGSAMRVPPLGAFFSDAPEQVIIEQASNSAAPTHAHLEGRAGAIASAAAWAARQTAAPARAPELSRFVTAPGCGGLVAPRPAGSGGGRGWLLARVVTNDDQHLRLRASPARADALDTSPR
jgi:ADP-ribosylglycohydrolase